MLAVGRGNAPRKAALRGPRLSVDHGDELYRACRSRLVQLVVPAASGPRRTTSRQQHERGHRQKCSSHVLHLASHTPAEAVRFLAKGSGYLQRLSLREAGFDAHDGAAKVKDQRVGGKAKGLAPECPIRIGEVEVVRGAGGPVATMPGH